ncbi:MAG: hypothetical protein Q9160_000655 [Pyrenula sp. 1 TL-2023]
MPLPILGQAFFKGIDRIPFAWPILKFLPWVLLISLLKRYFGGAVNRAERLMHGKVVMVTGGTSGIGAAIVQDLASRGAQIILLTHHSPTDGFLNDYIEDLRDSTKNELIYAEQVDLSSLHSIRLFATKWVDNAPPRRLDMIILCADTMTPTWGKRQLTTNGLEEEWMINYLSTFHLLSILSPAIRAQPPDRDVRVIFSTCSSYIGATLDTSQTDVKTVSGKRSYGRSKLALMVFAQAFEKHLASYKRPDKQAVNTRTFIVDPGFCRTPGTRRWLTGGSLWGLLLYLLTWPFWWMVLKSPQQGAQSHLLAVMEGALAVSGGGFMIKECRQREFLRKEVSDEDVAKRLWEFSEKQIEQIEKQGAVKRALAKKEAEIAEKGGKKDTTAEGSPATPAPGGEKEKKQASGSRRNRKAK